MKISLIAAMDRNRNIGFKGDMPWGDSMKSDLQYFKKLTMGHTVVMGRKTYESIGHPLPGRENIVMTTQKEWEEEGVTVVHCLPGALASSSNDNVFVIGGAQIYDEFMKITDVIYLTKIHAYLEGDTKFPPITGKWKIQHTQPFQLEGDKYPSQYFEYTRQS